MRGLIRGTVLAFGLIGCAWAGGNEEELYPEVCSVVKQDDLLQHYKHLGAIGSGGQSLVFKVEYSKEKLGALVVKSQMEEGPKIDFIKPLFETIIKNQSVNPHIAKVYNYFWIEIPNHYYFGGVKKGVCPWKNIENKFLNDFYKDDPTAIKFLHQAVLMELGIGDLESKAYKDLNFDESLRIFMWVMGSYSIDKTEILTNDTGKLRNWIFVETKGQLYNGKDMSTFDYWCYSDGEQYFYIPTPSHFIKMIDFGGWRFQKPEDINFCKKVMEEIHGKGYQKPSLLEYLTIELKEHYKITEDQVREKFMKKPDVEEHKILNITL